MDHCNLYTDIATRTGGDIYIGVVLSLIHIWSRLLILLRAAAETWISARLEATIKSRTILRPHRRTLPSPRRRARATEPLLHSGAGSAFRALPV